MSANGAPTPVGSLLGGSGPVSTYARAIGRQPRKSVVTSNPATASSQGAVNSPALLNKTAPGRKRPRGGLFGDGGATPGSLSPTLG